VWKDFVKTVPMLTKAEEFSIMDVNPKLPYQNVHRVRDGRNKVVFSCSRTYHFSGMYRKIDSHINVGPTLTLMGQYFSVVRRRVEYLANRGSTELFATRTHGAMLLRDKSIRKFEHNQLLDSSSGYPVYYSNLSYIEQQSKQDDRKNRVRNIHRYYLSKYGVCVPMHSVPTKVFLSHALLLEERETERKQNSSAVIITNFIRRSVERSKRWRRARHSMMKLIFSEVLNHPANFVNKERILQRRAIEEHKANMKLVCLEILTREAQTKRLLELAFLKHAPRFSKSYRVLTRFFTRVVRPRIRRGMSRLYVTRETLDDCGVWFRHMFVKAWRWLSPFAYPEDSGLRVGGISSAVDPLHRLVQGYTVYGVQRTEMLDLGYDGYVYVPYNRQAYMWLMNEHPTGAFDRHHIQYLLREALLQFPASTPRELFVMNCTVMVAYQASQILSLTRDSVIVPH